MKASRIFYILCCALLLASCSLRARLGEILPGAQKDSVALKGDARTEKTRVIIRLAFPDDASWPRNSRRILPSHAGALAFKAALEALTRGEVAVALYPDGALGNPAEVLALVRSGGIEAAFSSGALGKIYPPLQVVNLPYAFDSPEALWDFFDRSPLWKELKGELEETAGLTVLASAQGGFLHFSNSKQPVHTPADLRGLRIAVADLPIHGETAKALGCLPLAVPPRERRAALEKNQADGTEGTLWDMDARGWYTAQKYLALDSHIMAESLLVMNTRFLSGLPEEYERAVREASREAEQMSRLTEALLSRSLEYLALNAALEVHALASDEEAAFRAAVRPVYDWLRLEIGGGLINRFLTEKSSFFAKSP